MKPAVMRQALLRFFELRWWVRKDVWYPAGVLCRLRGHGDFTYYDGYWCGRCGARADPDPGLGIDT